MKGKLLHTVLLIIIVLNFSTFTVLAGEWGKDCGDFEYRIKDGYARIMNYNGNDENVTIPNEVDGYKVIGIGRFGKNKKTLKTLNISEGIENIEDYAFSWSSIESVVIPNTVTRIEENAFEHCDSLTEITIPESVTTIGDEAFRECENLTTANIMGSTVGATMFSGCTKLKTVNLGKNVRTIGEMAFIGCKGMTDITIPENVTTIEKGAFRATGLKSVIIPESITDLKYNVFEYCSNLEKVIFKNPNTKFMETDGITYAPMTPEFPTFYSCDKLSDFYAFKGSQAQEYSLNNNLEFTPIARVEVNGETVKTDVPPVIKNNRVLIPMRAIFEALGAEIDWNGETRTVVANTASNSVIMQINNAAITVNGEVKGLDVAPEILMNRALVPARAVSESLGAKVSWDEERQTVVISY